MSKLKLVCLVFVIAINLENGYINCEDLDGDYYYSMEQQSSTTADTKNLSFNKNNESNNVTYVSSKNLSGYMEMSTLKLFTTMPTKTETNPTIVTNPTDTVSLTGSGLNKHEEFQSTTPFTEDILEGDGLQPEFEADTKSLTDVPKSNVINDDTSGDFTKQEVAITTEQFSTTNANLEDVSAASKEENPEGETASYTDISYSTQISVVELVNGEKIVKKLEDYLKERNKIYSEELEHSTSMPVLNLDLDETSSLPNKLDDLTSFMKMDEEFLSTVTDDIRSVLTTEDSDIEDVASILNVDNDAKSESVFFTDDPKTVNHKKDDDYMKKLIGTDLFGSILGSEAEKEQIENEEINKEIQKQEEALKEEEIESSNYEPTEVMIPLNTKYPNVDEYLNKSDEMKETSKSYVIDITIDESKDVGEENFEEQEDYTTTTKKYSEEANEKIKISEGEIKSSDDENLSEASKDLSTEVLDEITETKTDFQTTTGKHLVETTEQSKKFTAFGDQTIATTETTFVNFVDKISSTESVYGDLEAEGSNLDYNILTNTEHTGVTSRFIGDITKISNTYIFIPSTVRPPTKEIDVPETTTFDLTSTAAQEEQKQTEDTTLDAILPTATVKPELEEEKKLFTQKVMDVPETSQLFEVSTNAQDVVTEHTESAQEVSKNTIETELFEPNLDGEKKLNIEKDTEVNTEFNLPLNTVEYTQETVNEHLVVAQSQSEDTKLDAITTTTVESKISEPEFEEEKKLLTQKNIDIPEMTTLFDLLSQTVEYGSIKEQLEGSQKQSKDSKLYSTVETKISEQELEEETKKDTDVPETTTFDLTSIVPREVVTEHLEIAQRQSKYSKLDYMLPTTTVETKISEPELEEENKVTVQKSIDETTTSTPAQEDITEHVEVAQRQSKDSKLDSMLPTTTVETGTSEYELEEEKKISVQENINVPETTTSDLISNTIEYAQEFIKEHSGVAQFEDTKLEETKLSDQKDQLTQSDDAIREKKTSVEESKAISETSTSLPVETQTKFEEIINDTSSSTTSNDEENSNSTLTTILQTTDSSDTTQSLDMEQLDQSNNEEVNSRTIPDFDFQLNEDESNLDSVDLEHIKQIEAFLRTDSGRSEVTTETIESNMLMSSATPFVTGDIYNTTVKFSLKIMDNGSSFYAPPNSYLHYNPDIFLLNITWKYNEHLNNTVLFKISKDEQGICSIGAVMVRIVKDDNIVVFRKNMLVSPPLPNDKLETVNPTNITLDDNVKIFISNVDFLNVLTENTLSVNSITAADEDRSLFKTLYSTINAWVIVLISVICIIIFQVLIIVRRRYLKSYIRNQIPL